MKPYCHELGGPAFAPTALLLKVGSPEWSRTNHVNGTPCQRFHDQNMSSASRNGAGGFRMLRNSPRQSRSSFQAPASGCWVVAWPVEESVVDECMSTSTAS